MPSVISRFCPGFAGIRRDGSPRESRCARSDNEDNEQDVGGKLDCGSFC